MCIERQLEQTASKIARNKNVTNPELKTGLSLLAAWTAYDGGNKNYTYEDLLKFITGLESEPESEVIFEILEDECPELLLEFVEIITDRIKTKPQRQL